MQISLRSQMIAGTTAFVGATAIAMTPVAPAISIPSISTANSAVALAAYANPISALLSTVGVTAGYLLNGSYSPQGAVNWPAANISNTVNGALKLSVLPTPPFPAGTPGPGYQAPGLLPQIILDGLPIATQLASNAFGYLYNTALAVGTAVGAIGNIVWSIPTTALAIGLDLISFNIPAVVADIQAFVTGTLASINTAGTALLGAGQFVLSNVIAKASAVLATVTALLPSIITSTQAQFGVLASSVVGTVQSIIAGTTAPNPIEGVWNAAVNGLLGPTGIPGTILNLTLGAGVQVNPADPTTLVPSARTEVQTGVKAVARALAVVPPAPAASVSAASVRADAAPAAAVSVEAAPAAEATAGDNSAAAEEATTAAPAASAAAADDSTSSDAPKASKAGAARAGR